MSRWGPIVALVLAALLLRLHHLNDQLWLDEMSALQYSIRRPLAQIVTEWPGTTRPISSHVLFEILSHLSRGLLGECPFSVRLPAVLFGAAGVYALYALGVLLFTRAHALVIAALYAVSYLGIFYAQNARGYTTLIFFHLVASLLFLRFRGAPKIPRRHGLLYAAVTVLVCYSQPFGVFVPAAHFLWAAGEGLVARWRRRRPGFPLPGYLVYLAGAAVVTALLYAPFLGSMRAHMAMNVTTRAEGYPVGGGLFLEVLDGLAPAFGGAAGVAAVGLVGLAAGGLAYRGRRLAAFLILGLPVVVELAAFAACGFALHPRYFAVALPVAYTAAGYALVELLGLAGARRPGRPWRRGLLAAAALTAVVVLSAVPLKRYYRLQKQDLAGAYHALEGLAGPTDLRIGVRMAGYALRYYYGDASYTYVHNLAQLELEEKAERRIWLLTTLEGILGREEPALLAHIKRHYRLVRLFPGTVGGGAVRIYAREHASPR